MAATAHTSSSRPGPVDDHRVLVVDDNPMYLELMSLMLAHLGYAPELAEDGMAALDRCRANPPRAVLMDVEMPRLDGLEATRTIRGLQHTGHLPKFPIIGTTALTSPEDVQRCLDAGMEACLLKPVQLSRLAVQLSQAMGTAAAPLP